MGYTTGLVEGFLGARDKAYEENQKRDLATRQGEAQLYQYLMQSKDPQIKALALSGLFESARPGSKAKGLRGFMGEVQQGQIYPQLVAAMNEMVPDEEGGAPAAPGSGVAKPGAAAMPTGSPVEPGSAPMPRIPGQSDQGPAMIDAPAAMAPAAPEGAGPQLGGPAPMAPIAAAPRMHRRGTGVPTAEEIADSQARIQARAKIQEGLAGFRGAQSDDERRLVSGMMGAPLPLDSTATGPVMADPSDPSTPIPTIRHRDGSVTTTDGTPVETLGLVGYVKPAASGGLTSTIRDSPAIRAQYGIPANAVTPSGYWHIKQIPGQPAQVMAAEYTPTPAFGGTATFDDPNSPTGRVVGGIPRNGGAPRTLGPAPAPSGEKTPAQTEAEGWMVAVDKQITDTRRPGLPVRGDARNQATQKISGGKYQTYGQLAAAAKGGGAAAVRGASGGGGIDPAALRARMEANRAAAAGSAPPPPPARVGGAGPVGR